MHNSYLTTVVGSYPIVHRLDATPMHLWKEFQTWFKRKKYVKQEYFLDAFDYLVAYAVIDQVVIARGRRFERPGIDVISTGQPSLSILRDMNEPFYEVMHGVSYGVDGLSRLDGEIADIKYHLDQNNTNYWLREVIVTDLIMAFLDNRHPDWDARFKINFTGPATLTAGINSGLHIADNVDFEECAERIANVICSAFQSLRRRKGELLKYCHHIQIDEPVVTKLVPLNMRKTLQDIYKSMFKSIVGKSDMKIVLHICGRMSPDILNDFCVENLHAIDVEVSHCLTNDDIPNHKYVTDIADTFVKLDTPVLGIGCVDSSGFQIEPPAFIASTVRLICDKWKDHIVAEQYGSRVILSPDCGLRGITLPDARCKLRNMVEASVLLREREQASKYEFLYDCQKRAPTAGILTSDSEDMKVLFGKMHSGTAFSSSDELRRVEKIVHDFDRCLEALAGGPTLSRFTLHGQGHSRSVIYLVNQIIGEIDILRSDEIQSLFISSYGHDIGLHAPKELDLWVLDENPQEIKNLIEKIYYEGSPIFDEFKRYKSIKDLENDWDRNRFADMISHKDDIIRQAHGLRSALIFRMRIKDKCAFSNDEAKAFEEMVWSHQSSARLPDPAREIGNYRIAPLAAILRIADEIDISEQRLPFDTVIDEVSMLVTESKNLLVKQSVRISKEEYRKMKLVKFVEVNHSDKTIYLHHSGNVNNMKDMVLINSIVKKIEMNLVEHGSSEALAVVGIHLEKVAAKPISPAIVAYIQKHAIAGEIQTG